MFKKLTDIVLKELDNSGDMKSFKSVTECMKLDVLSVVKIIESKKFFLSKKKLHHHTEFKLQQLLDDTDTVDIGGFHKQSIGSLDLTEGRRVNCGIKLAVPTIGEGGVECESQNVLSATEIKLESVSVGLQELHSMLLKSIINQDHLLIEEMEKDGRIQGLGVVYEVMKSKNPVILEQATGREGRVNLSVTKGATVKIDAGAKLDRKPRVQVDAGCVLGFKVHPVPLDRMRFARTISDGLKVIEFRKAAETPRSAIETVGGFGEGEARDFPRLKRFVEGEFFDFGEMDQSVKERILGPLYKTMKCPEALYALDYMLEEGNISTASSSLQEVPEDVRLNVQDLLQVMGLDSVESSDPHNLRNPIGLLVGAMSELDEEAVTLILDLDSEVRGQVLKLVEGVLEQVCPKYGGAPPQSGEFSENTMGAATEIMKSCGLKLSEDSLDPSLGSPGVPVEALLALYITLKGLNLLLKP